MSQTCRPAKLDFLSKKVWGYNHYAHKFKQSTWLDIKENILYAITTHTTDFSLSKRYLPLL